MSRENPLNQRADELAEQDKKAQEAVKGALEALQQNSEKLEKLKNT